MGSVLLDNGNEAIGVRADGIEDGAVLFVAVLVGASVDIGNQSLEEVERNSSDSDGLLLSPNGQGVVKLLGSGKGREIPGVTVVVDILDVATDGDSLALVNALVDCVASE